METTDGPSIGVLRNVFGSTGLTDQQLGRIADAGRYYTVAANWPIIQEQTPAQWVYVLLSGEVAVYAGHSEIARVGAGDVVGEGAAQPGRLRNATVTSKGPAQVLRFEREQLPQLFRQFPAFERFIADAAARHSAPAGDH
jgi:CRP-like cAMP-binding protein